MATKKRGKKSDWVDWGEPESQPQIGPSLHFDENLDPTPPPYRRYLPDPEKKKVRKK